MNTLRPVKRGRALLILSIATLLGTSTARAQCGPFLYDFNPLSPGTILGQDGWLAGYPTWQPGTVADAAGYDGSRALLTTTDQTAAQGALRPLAHPFYYSADSGITSWSFRARMSSTGAPGNRDAQCGLLFHNGTTQEFPLIYFGIWQCNLGCLNSRPYPIAMVQTAVSNQERYGSALVFDHWYEFRLFVDWRPVGGRATLQYRDLTLGQVNFQDDPLLVGFPLGLTPVGGVYTAWQVVTRMDQTGGTSIVDDLSFDDPQAMPPAPTADESATTCPGGGAILRVSATGSPPFTYQWQSEDNQLPENWNNIDDGPMAGIGTFSGTTTAEMTISDLTANAAGNYRCMVSNTCGPVQSNVAMLTVVPGGYANCDRSTFLPVLNVNDFACFINNYAAGDPYANCDGSTSAPVLNVNDFICFQQKFAAGCP